MFCPNCGINIDAGNACPKCGFTANQATIKPVATATPIIKPIRPKRMWYETGAVIALIAMALLLLYNISLGYIADLFSRVSAYNVFEYFFDNLDFVLECSLVNTAIFFIPNVISVLVPAAALITLFKKNCNSKNTMVFISLVSIVQAFDYSFYGNETLLDILNFFSNIILIVPLVIALMPNFKQNKSIKFIIWGFVLAANIANLISLYDSYGTTYTCLFFFVKSVLVICVSFNLICNSDECNKITSYKPFGIVYTKPLFAVIPSVIMLLLDIVSFLFVKFIPQATVYITYICHYAFSIVFMYIKGFFILYLVVFFFIALLKKKKPTQQGVPQFNGFNQANR